MKKGFALVLKIVISILLVYLMIKFTKLDLVKTFEILKASNWFWFGASCLATLATIFTNTYRWRLLALQSGYRLSYLESLKMYFEAMFSNNFLPSNFGGDAWRSYELGRTNKAWLKAASTVIMERLFGFTMMFALMPIAIIIMNFSMHKGAIPEKLVFALWMSFVSMIVFYAAYPLWSRINLGFIQKIKVTFEEYTGCMDTMKNVAIWTFITHVFLMSSNVFAALAIGIGPSQIPIWYWFIVVPTSILLSFVIPAVKGASPKETVYITLLGFIGIGSSEAYAIGFLIFLATLITTVPGVSIVFRKNKNPEPEEN